MDKYKKLISNTAIFAIGTFSSKVLVFLLMPLYTRVLDSSEYGVTDLIMQTGNLLVPFISLGIINAIIRFGLDKHVRKTDVFMTGLLCILGGFGILLLFWPLMGRIPFLQGHTALIYLFILFSSLRSLCSQFVRARGMVRLFAVDGIISTVTTVVLQVLFMVTFRWGVFGYILAIACSDAFSVLFLTVSASLYKFIQFRLPNRKISLDMLRYAVPMIPNTMLWWVTNASDRYLVAWMLGNDLNGLYAVAYKVPSLITLASGIFMDAWQLSAVTEEKDRSRFFSRVFHSYSSLLFMLGSGAIVFAKLITTILVSPDYYTSWQYIPILVLATVYACLTNFLGSIYMVEKKSVLSLATTTVGAVANIALNLVLIPKLGVNGAAVATFASYFIVFLLRVRDTKRFLRIRWRGLRLAVDTLLLMVQCWLMIAEVPLWIVWESILLVLMLVLNANDILIGLKKLLNRKAA